MITMVRVYVVVILVPDQFERTDAFFAAVETSPANSVRVDSFQMFGEFVGANTLEIAGGLKISGSSSISVRTVL
jgi:hypothetical protein